MSDSENDDARRLLEHDVVEAWAEHLCAGSDDLDFDAWLVLGKLLELGRL